MDPSTWMDPYGHLRVPTRNAETNGGVDSSHQLNSCSHQMSNHNRNLQHHMAAAAALQNNHCHQKNSTTAVTGNHHSNMNNKNHHKQPTTTTPVTSNPHYPTQNHVNHHATGQTFMNGHYGTPNTGSTWLQNHENSVHLKGHPDNGNISSYGSNPFSLPPHSGVYDPNFMSAAASSFAQTTKSNGYLSSMASDLVDQMARNDANMNYRTGTYCPSTGKPSSFNMNETCSNARRDTNLSANGFFPSPMSATNAWHHHQNHHFMPSNVSAANGHNGMFHQHDQQVHSMMHTPCPNAVAPEASRNHTSSNRNGSINSTNGCTTNPVNGTCNIGKHPSSNAVKSHSKTTPGAVDDHQVIPNQMNHNNLCQPYKNSAAMNSTFSNMPLNSNNPYLMQNIPVNRNSQNSFVDPSFSAKFAAAHAAAHHDPYAFFAAQAEYAFQQSNPHKHSQYVSSMNHQYQYPHNSNRQTSEYAPVAPNFKTTNRQNDFINYCSASLFPMTHPDVSSMNPAAAFKSHNPFLEIPEIPEIVPQQQQQQPVKSTRTRKKAKTAAPPQPPPPPPPPVNNISFNEYSTNCLPNGAINTGNNCCLASNNSSVNPNRCPSVTTSNHHSVAQSQQPNSSNDSSSYSYNYPSPITTNLSVHSPYQQRSMSSGSSHSSVNSCALSNGAQEYMNYGTPNSAPPTVFPTMATSQTPTPTPGYPTPPSSVGHSNSRGTSNEELSPYSNNSMSSNMSHHSYGGGRNDFNKSNSSSSSQISPKQVNDVTMSESLQFNSCMVASKNSMNGSTAASTLPQSSPSLYSSNVIPDTSSYKSPPYYSNHMSNGALSNDSTDTYASYVAPKDSATSMHQMVSSQESIKLQVPPANTESDGSIQMATAANSFNYNFSQTQSDNSFHGHPGYVTDKELSSCSKESDSQRSSSHLIPQLSENDKNGDYQMNGGQNLAASDEDQFNLNFESVIQPIEVDMAGSVPSSQPDVGQQQPPPPPPTQNMGDSLVAEIPMQLDELGTQKSSSFQPMNDLNFIPEQDQNDKIVDDYSSVASVNQNDHSVASQPLNGQCDQIAYEPSHEAGPLMGDEPATIDSCNNIDSLIHSLPHKPDTDCLATEKNGDTELLPGATNTDNFLSDLAPLMNDSSKIALMESTFKSNQPMESVDHPSVITEKLHKTIFDDMSKIDNQLAYSKSADDDDNQFRDVDEFLKSNYKESPENETTLNDIKNELNNETVGNNIAVTPVGSTLPKEDSTVQTPDVIAISNENRKSDDLRKSTKKSTKSSSNSKKASTVSLKRKSNDVKPDTNSSKTKKSKSNSVSSSGGTSIIKNVAESEFKENVGKPNKTKTSKKTSHSPSVISISVPKPNKKTCAVSNTSSSSLSIKELPVVNIVVKKDLSIGPKTSDSNIETTSKKLEEKCSSSTAKKSSSSSKPSNLKPVAKIEKKSLAPILSIGVVSKSELKENSFKTTNKLIAPKLKITPSPIDQAKEMSKNMSNNNSKILEVPSSKKTKINHEKKPVNDPKRIKSVPIVSTSSASPQLLSPNLITNGTCLNKPVNPTITNVTPTLIVNQGHSVNPYQVSPMTNAVLISIHPANPTPIPSLTAQSFITLATQSVTSTTNSNTTTTTTSGSNQNASRRRSQDKKVSTIREGLMRTGDFVVAEEEAHLDLPVIWRIEGKSLLQRFEPSEQNGTTVYSNTSSYSAWNPTVRQKYLGLDVRIMGCNRTRIVVEKIGLTQSKSDIRETSSLDEKESSAALPTDNSPSNIDNLKNFEILIQTLISEALDSKFIAEIVKDNDEYFLSCMQIIEDVCHKRRSRLIAKIKWDNGMLKNFETYPTIQIHKQNNVGDLRCRSCHDNWSTKILYFEGEPYNRETLEILAKETESKKVKIAACDSCAEKIFLYSKLYHHRYNFLLCCKSKVDDIQNKDPNKESPEILDECLQDRDWVEKMFQELESLLLSCDMLC